MISDQIDKEVAELFNRAGYWHQWHWPLIGSIATWARMREASLMKEVAHISAWRDIRELIVELKQTQAELVVLRQENEKLKRLPC